MKYLLVLLFTAVSSIAHTQPGKIPATNEAENDLFLSNKGKLICPVQGKISMHFGQQPGNATYYSSFTTFQTASVNATVQAVFDGVVKYTAMDEDSTYVVMITHAGILSIYGNLSSVTVTNGQSITTGTVIGRTSKSYNDSKGEMEFGIYQNKKLVNPEPWLSCR